MFIFLLLPPPPIFTLFPYTTLFRSCRVMVNIMREPMRIAGKRKASLSQRNGLARANKRDQAVDLRSEEHTSELQSLRHLVCRLLLEKKKMKDKPNRLIAVRATHPLF